MEVNRRAKYSSLGKLLTPKGKKWCVISDGLPNQSSIHRPSITVGGKGPFFRYEPLARNWCTESVTMTCKNFHPQNLFINYKSMPSSSSFSFVPSSSSFTLFVLCFNTPFSYPNLLIHHVVQGSQVPHENNISKAIAVVAWVHNQKMTMPRPIRLVRGRRYLQLWRSREWYWW